MSMRTHHWGAVIAGIAGIACGSDGSPGTPNPTPASLSVTGGNLQSGLAGQTLPTSLTVLVRDQSGQPVPGVSVTWVVTAGGGAVSSSGATTSTGRGSATWTLGPSSGENTLEASIQGVSTPAHFSAIAVSPQTAIAYEAWLTAGRSPTEILLMNPDGTGAVNLTHHAADDGEPAWSPDRSKIAFKSDRDGRPGFLDYDIYVMKIDGTGLTRLTTTPERDIEADWSPDGTRIAFSSLRDGNFEIYVMNVDGSNQVRLTNDPGGDENPDWSPDGTKILFATTRYGNREIAVMNPDGTGVTRLTNDQQDDDEPVWSPDGTSVAFATSRFQPGVAYEVAVMNANGTGVTRLAVHPGNLNDYGPTWSPDGAKIAYTCWRLRGSETFSEVCSMNADGAGEVRLTFPAIPWASWAAWRH